MQREYHAFIIMIGYCLPEAFSSPSNLYFFLHWPLWFLRLHSIWMQVQPLSQFLTRGKNRARWLLPLPRGLVEHWLCRSFSGRLGATCPFLLVPPTQSNTSASSGAPVMMSVSEVGKCGHREDQDTGGPGSHPEPLSTCHRGWKLFPFLCANGKLVQETEMYLSRRKKQNSLFNSLVGSNHL